MDNKTLTVKVYADPGHSWGAVKLKTLEMLGIAERITRFSYQKGGTAYLEEDCDLGTFHQAAKEQGYTVVYTEKHSDKRSPIRSYCSYYHGAAQSITV